MKRPVAIAITALVLLAVLWFAKGREVGTSQETPLDAPEATVREVFRAAETGDVDAYFACFTGEHRQRLERELQSQSRPAFAQSLRNGFAALKGLAVQSSNTTSGGDSSDSRRVTVEQVYAHRVDRQEYLLTRLDGRWLIRSVRPVNPRQPAKAYGTPVYAIPEATEGNQPVE